MDVMEFTERSKTMIKTRTPQEIADFFGRYVAMDKHGHWYVYVKKPKRLLDSWVLLNSVVFQLDENIVDWQGDWKDSLHNPQGSKSEGSTVHHSEHVFVEEPKKERKIVDYDVSRASDVREFLQNGWELYGNPFIDAGGCIMQVIIKRK